MLNIPKYLIVHHTGGTDKDPLADTSHHTFEMVDQYHRSKGWEMIGYHYFIEKDGILKIGRAENYHGAHTIGHNEDSIGICLAGNFDQTLPTKEQEETLKILLKDLQKKFSIPKENILPHRHFANKTCYGRRLSDEWAMNLVAEENKEEILLKALLEIKNKAEELLNKYA